MGDGREMGRNCLVIRHFTSSRCAAPPPPYAQRRCACILPSAPIAIGAPSLLQSARGVACTAISGSLSSSHGDFSHIFSHRKHGKHGDFPTDGTDGHRFSHTENTENTEDFPTDGTDGHGFSHTEITEITEKMSVNYRSFLSVFSVLSV